MIPKLLDAVGARKTHGHAYDCDAPIHAADGRLREVVGGQALQVPNQRRNGGEVEQVANADVAVAIVVETVSSSLYRIMDHINAIRLTGWFNGISQA